MNSGYILSFVSAIVKRVAMTLTLGLGLLAGTGNVQADTMPVASFTATPTNGAAPLSVTFTDASTGTITNRHWDFGDGYTTDTTATNLSHIYNVSGAKTVSLTVSGPLGTSNMTRANYIVAVYGEGSGLALEFDGIQNFAQSSYDRLGVLANLNQETLECWIRFTNFPPSSGIIMGQTDNWASDNDGWYMQVDDYNLWEFDWSNSDLGKSGRFNAELANWNLYDGYWHHLAVTLDDAGDIWCWTDGQLTGGGSTDNTTAIASESSSIMVGAGNNLDGNASNSNGSESNSPAIIDEVRISNTYWYTNATENINSGASFTPVRCLGANSNVLAYYTMDTTNSTAQFNWPSGVAIDTNGNLYVADTHNSTIRKITPVVTAGITNWVTTTIAGSAGNSGTNDGINSTARFNQPQGVAVDTVGNVDVADTENSTIRKITPVVTAGITNWVTTTIAGCAGCVRGHADGTNSTARFNWPQGVAVDTVGNVDVADSYNNTIRKITPVVTAGITNWVTTTIAGLAGNSGTKDGTNSTARFDWPTGVAVDTNGNLYVADGNNSTIRKITPSDTTGTNWVTTTIAGSAGNTGTNDGINSIARFDFPVGVAVGTNGNLYVADTYGNTIRKTTPSDTTGTNWLTTTIAGLGGISGIADGTNSTARFSWPQGVVPDTVGNVYVADSSNENIRKITPSGANWVTTTIAGLAGFSGSADNATTIPDMSGNGLTLVLLGNPAPSFVTGVCASPPVAGFTATPTNGTAPLAVTFTNTSSGTITNSFWNFGDGTTNTTAISLSHTYAVAGTNTVSLTASGPLGSNTLTRTDYIVVTNPPPPVANFTGSPTNGTAPLTVTFTDGSTGNITNRFWNFGDFSTTNTTATTMSHTYAAGTYDVSLTVSGLGGANTQTQPGYITVLTPASISVLPVAYDFGTLATGMTAQTTFTVSNSGGTTVSNGTATVSSPFLIVSGSSFSIPGFGSTNVVVEFAPLDEDNFITNVVFATANGGNSTNQVTGIGLTLGSISVSPDTTDFGLVKTGTTSSSSLVVTNTGGMTVSNITATMTSGSAWFTISNNVTFPFNLSGYHAKSVSMVFTPGTATGALSGTVAFVSDNGGNSTNTLLGDGTGSGTTFIWTNGSGYWQSYTAWVTNGTSGTGGYPGFNDSALFTNAATYTVTLSNDVSAIGSNFFSNTSNTLATVTLNLGNYLLNPAYTGTSPGAFLVGDGSRSTTTVYLASSTVSGKGLYVPGRIVVGRNGIGTLFVTNGNVLVNNTILGNGNNARGTLVISGPSAVYSNASGASPLFSIGNATNSFGNALVISNQAVMVVGSTFRLGSGSTSGGSSNNTLLLDSGGMLVCGAGPITIGHNSTGKPPSYNNTATVQGGAVWNCQNHTFVIGSLSNVASGNYGATGNVLTIKSGGTVNNISWLTITATNTLDMQGGMMSGTTTNYGTIQGYGTFLKTITVASNAVLSASNSLGSLVFSNALNLTTGAVMQVSLGTTTYSSVVASNLQIRAGILDITNSGGFTNGVYTLFTYTRPHLTYEGLTIRNVPDTNLTYSIDINTTGQVNLVTAFPPVASFTAHPTNGVTPLDVTFTDTSVGTITNWVWDFGDGNTANVATGIVIHTYDTGGVYTVSLTINAYGGSSSATESNYIVLINPAHLVVDPVSLNYGSVTIGQTSNQNFSVINTGDVSLSGTATIAVAGPFAVTGGSPYTATGGQTSSVTVAFAPSAPGPTNGSVIFTSNGGDLTNNVTGIGVCIYALSSSGASFPAMGGTNTVGVITASPCLWNATPNDIWLTISSGGSGTGAGTVTYVVAPNASSSARTGTISIADQTFTVAQAGDTTPPTVVLTEPASGATVSNTIAVSATATDDVGVMSVEFYRGAGVLIGTITTPPYSVNFDTRTVSNGPNCFYARAYDAAHNVGSSLTNCVTVTDNDPAVPTGLTATAVSSNEVDLSWNASGGVVAGYKVFRYGVLIAMTTSTNDSDSGLATGTEYCYQVAAYDHVGRESALSADVCVQTFVAPGSLRGTYNGLVIQTNAPTHESSGSIELVVSKTGSFAASLRMGGRRSGFNGRFDGSGESTNTVVRRGLNALQVILHLDVADDSERITGTVSNDVFTSELLANRAVYNRTNLCPLAGSYTVVLEPPGGDSANIPQGNGYGRITVTTIGSGKLRGILSDGRRIAGNVPVSKYGTWPLYEALYKKQGSCIGWITFTTNSTFEATVDWFRPAISTARYYPSGFATNVTLTGGKYVSPKAGGSSPAGDRQITLGWGNLVSNIVQAVSVDANGNVTVLPPNRQDLRMKLQLSTGLFSGFFIHPSLEMPISFNGAVLQFDNSGAGYFLGTNESGFVVIGPMP